MSKLMTAAAACAALSLPYASGQSTTGQKPGTQMAIATATCRGTALNGTIRDSTQALIPGAKVMLDGAPVATAGSDGRFRLTCVADGQHSLTIAAEGFADRNLALKTPRPAGVDVTLVAGETVNVDVNAEDNPPATTNASGASATLSGNRLQALADDPDDLLRQLQQLAALSGGNPANTTIAVDGFQGDSALPPKASIAYIKVNPDQFSAEYREPPFDGGRVEVYTKPGQKAFHGALFTTQGEPFENARDPFSTSKAAIGKQRYGFELTGPIQKGSDFALTLEHRSIDNFAVVDAFTLDPTGNLVNTTANVATPQRLWLATARVDWQLGPKNTFIASYSANSNHLANQGVGGTTLAEAAYDAQKYEHMVRVSDITTASVHLMHEARLSFRWNGYTDSPVSTAPQIQVAGAFTGGGASVGGQQKHELNIEADDDAILTTKNHTFKAGMQLQTYIEHQQLTGNFNGTYTFANLAQYQANTPYSYSNVAGTPAVNFTQLQQSFFAQDDWNAGRGLRIAYGLRYAWATNPTMLSSIDPRLGILWSPNKKGTWTLHAHAGMFAGNYGTGVAAEVLREDGVHRVTSTVYNPVFGNPFLGATPIHSIRQFNPKIANINWVAENIGGTRSLPHGWNLSLDFYLGRIWNDIRSENINSPLNGVPTGPRPGPANTNILEVQNSGQGPLTAEFWGIENHTYKRVQFFFGGIHVDLRDDTDDNPFFTPQNSHSDVGEYAHRTGQTAWNLFGNSTITLPKKVQLSTDFNAGGDSHYNITTGFDNNGDGDFNDRPQYAAPGTPGAIQTPFGLLVASGGTGIFPRNKGVLPWTIHLDTNLQRAFKMTRNAKAEHQQTLTLNIRSSNVLNHLNVTNVGGVLGSPLFGVANAADNGRRIEAGARYSF